MRLIWEGFDALKESLDARCVFGEPIQEEGRVRIPVRRMSVWGIVLPLGRIAKARESDPADGELSVWKRTRELGHLVVDSKEVRWHPKMSLLKLAGASFFLFVALFSLERRWRKASVEG